MIDAAAVRQIMQDKRLAGLGDAYVNFVYSLAITRINGNPHGVKVSDRILASAFKLAGLRCFLGTRLTRKDLANASEALLIESYQRGLLSIEESVNMILQDPRQPVFGFSNLLRLAVERLNK